MPSKRDTRSELAEGYEILKEITKKKRNENEPGRKEYALQVLKEKGYKPIVDEENKCIRFTREGNTITFWPYKGWFSGKGIKDGRGLKKLLKQI